MKPAACLVTHAESYRVVVLDDRERAEHLAALHHGTIEPLVRQRDSDEVLETLHRKQEPLPKAV